MYLLSVLSQFRGSLWPCSTGIFAWLRFVTWESNPWGKFFPTCWNITTSILRSVYRLLGRHVYVTWFCYVILPRDFVTCLSRDFVTWFLSRNLSMIGWLGGIFSRSLLRKSFMWDLETYLPLYSERKLRYVT